MGRPRFLCDHDLNEHIADGLVRREPAAEVVRAREVRMQEAPDDEVLAYASGRDMLVISHDVNTMPAAAHRRLAAGLPVPGLLMVQQGQPIGPVIESLLLIWSASEAEEWRGTVSFLPL